MNQSQTVCKSGQTAANWFVNLFYTCLGPGSRTLPRVDCEKVTHYVLVSFAIFMNGTLSNTSFRGIPWVVVVEDPGSRNVKNTCVHLCYLIVQSIGRMNWIIRYLSLELFNSKIKHVIISVFSF